ncbi:MULTISPECIES: hypothetical protein [Haloferax]|uniref:Uncharacterized protein n=1 Tax=Haloferax marinum TaxID=2666143 RepID=A0A6A8G4F0_9EURY|nr:MULTISPECIES: hypothetical protein [Haloferax]KAB1197067.1 hypothetical protein Hfx1150_05830 [Haloferax sp. CBA1150]MRW96094.1 hypothetical protein [Haloferax marinum]
MRALHQLRPLLSVFVYFVAATLGTGVLVVNPVRTLLVVPLLTVVVLLGHAVKTTHLVQFGHATLWLWGTILTLIICGLTVERFVIHQNTPALVEIPVVRFFGTLGLIAVLVIGYMRGIQGARRDDIGELSTA